MKRLSILLVLSVVLTFGINAQKFGYVNSAELMSVMPEVQSADAELETYQKQLVGQGQSKVSAFEDNYRKYLADVESKILSPIQMQEREKTLGEEQAAIKQFENEVQLNILKKREDLLSPILKKIDEAIQAMGKEGGYTFIFDTSVGSTMLFAPDDGDLIEELKRRLGVQ